MARIPILLFSLALALAFSTGCKSHKSTAATDSADTVTAVDYVKKGNIQLDLKNYKEALVLLNKAVEMDPENGEAIAYRGMAKLNLKDYKGAVTDFDAAIKLIPDYGEVYDLRGIAKGELGDKVGACEDWNQAFALGFNNAYKLIEKFCMEETK